MLPATPVGNSLNYSPARWYKTGPVIVMSVPVIRPAAGNLS